MANFLNEPSPNATDGEKKFYYRVEHNHRMNLTYLSTMLKSVSKRKIKSPSELVKFELEKNILCFSFFISFL